MSSTNRSNSRDEHISDYYITPIQSITHFLNEFLNDNPDVFKGIILDPCAGGDEKHLMSYPVALKQVLKKDTYDLKTIDIREDSLAEIKGDYLEIQLSYKPDIIITNPPFNIARNIIEKALNDVKDGGYVIMLLRLNFLGSKQRFDLWQTNLPKYIYVHHKRMSFQDNSKTDSIEYAHFVWKKGCNEGFSQLKVI